jgi:NAD(P)-dependent dehydrogenase (short-subunit alcohol dehydrogenase family)
VQDPLQYEGKRVVVTGAGSGMGESCATILSDLGAEVHGIDIKEGPAPVAAFHLCDLSNPAQIDKTVENIGGPIDSLFNCAGLPTTAPAQKIVVVNFVGHRHLTEAVIPLMAEGSSIGFISSVAGMGWTGNFASLLPLLETPDFASAAAWCQEHDEAIAPNGYGYSKEAINAYVAWRGHQLAPTGVRLNSINPGPTDTPMMPSFVESVGEEFFEKFPKPVGRYSRPDEQAWAIVMLNSPRSSYTTATTLFTDGGFTGGLFTGGIDFSLLLPSA